MSAELEIRKWLIKWFVKRPKSKNKKSFIVGRWYKKIENNVEAKPRINDNPKKKT